MMGGLLHLVQRGGAWAGCGPAQSPPRCTKCNTANGQCTNFMLVDVALCPLKGQTETAIIILMFNCYLPLQRKSNLLDVD